MRRNENELDIDKGMGTLVKRGYFTHTGLADKHVVTFEPPSLSPYTYIELLCMEVLIVSKNIRLH